MIKERKKCKNIINEDGKFTDEYFIQEESNWFINNSKKIYQYDLIENFIKEWNGTKEPSLELNINRGSIRNCLCKITKSAGGFIWKYNCHNEKIQNEKV